MDAPEFAQDPATSPTGDVEALRAAIRGMLAPLAALAVAKGLRSADVEEVVRQCFVEAALAEHAGVPRHRAASRVSATTGLHRREVVRLLDASPPEAPRRRSPATETFMRWLTDPAYRGDDGRPMALPRLGPAPSFETLAASVTRDLSARSLLEEICRLGLAEVDAGTSLVRLLQDVFVPRDDERRLLALVSANVGDHLSAVAANLLSRDKPPFVERAIFADELSAESIERLRPLFESLWQQTTRAAVPVIQSLIDEDQAAGRIQDRRVRLGLYTFSASTAPAADAASPATTDNKDRKEGS